MGLLDNLAIKSILAKFKDEAKSLGSVSAIWDYAKITTNFGKLVMAMVSELVAELDNDPDTDGAEKKKLVVEAAGELFDSLSGSLIGLPWWAGPVWSIVSPYVRSYAVGFAGGLVEWSLEKLRSGQLAVKLS